ncbi:MAG TPA: DUF4232 domain-containing protein [Mycobacteriales bacterium]|nr:DUF4232 domain-containing protein [Mycobacteriales bacterium]
MASWHPPPHTTGTAEPIGYALVSRDGRRVTVMVTGGGCEKAIHLTASETASRVILRVTRYDVTGVDVACPANLTIGTRALLLGAPLAGRPLLDGSRNKPIPYFDGRRLASIGWLPPGARGPADSLDGDGWRRTFTFADPKLAPVDIEQVPGNHLGEAQLRDPAYLRRFVAVHGHRGVLAVQPTGAHEIADDRLGWYDNGYTFTVESLPRWARQHPLRPAVLIRVARSLNTSWQAHTTCSQSALKVRLAAKVSEISQNDTSEYSIRNIGATPCTIGRGYPAVTLRDERGRLMPFRYVRRGDVEITDAPPQPLRLAPGRSVFGAINKMTCVAREVRRARTLTLRLARDVVLQLRIRSYPWIGYCPAGDVGHQVDVSPLSPTPSGVFAS